MGMQIRTRKVRQEKESLAARGGENLPQDSKRRSRCVGLYSILYVLLWGCILFYFISSSKSLVYHADAWRQHLRAYAYYGKWLRGLVWNVIYQHSWSVPSWSFSMGYGADVLTTLQYYCFGEPLALFTVFVPEEYTKYYFEFLIILRPYLAGLCFIFYSEYALHYVPFTGKNVTGIDARNRQNDAGLAAGAICYTFCGTVLYLGMLHPFFVTPMIYFPLLLLGVERILQEKEPMLFLLSVWMAGVMNFYFFYILAVLTAGYAVCRVIAERGGIRRILRRLAGILGYAIIGVMAAGAILVPVLIQFQGNPRSDTKFSLSLFYGAEYYRELLKNLTSFINHPEYDTELCMSCVCAAALLVLLLRRGHRQLKIAVLGCCLMLCLPAAGYVLNGFSYVINRWTFGAEFLLAFLLTVVWREVIKSRAAAAGGILAVVLTIGINIHAGYADHYDSSSGTTESGFTAEFIDAQTPKEYRIASQSDEALAVDLYAQTTGEQGDYRYTGRDLTYNAGAQKGVPSTQFFWSLTSDVVSDFFQELGVLEEQNFCYTGLDDRTILEALAGVRYYSIAYDNESEQQYVPFGFEDIGVISVQDSEDVIEFTENGIAGDLRGTYGDNSWESYHEGYHLYKSAFALPLGCTYISAITRTQLDSLSLTKRQEALVQSVVLEDDSSTVTQEETDAEGAVVLNSEPLSFYEEELTYELEASEGIQITNSESGFVFLVQEAGAQLTLHCDSKEAAELYLVLEDLNAAPLEGEELQEVYDLEISTSRFGVSGESKTIHYKTPQSQYYSGWKNFAVNLGYAEATADTITITFANAGVYTVSGMSVVSQPMQEIMEKSVELQVCTMTDVDRHENPISRASSTVTGRITAEQDRFLVFNIPYSSGWTAYDNGQKVDLQKANIMYMGIPISTGEHEITLVYHTPGEGIGRWMSLLGVLGMAVCEARRRLKS